VDVARILAHPTEFVAVSVTTVLLFPAAPFRGG